MVSDKKKTTAPKSAAGADHAEDEHHGTLASLYGMTPRVEAAVREALEAGAVGRVRALVAPLHSADHSITTR